MCSLHFLDVEEKEWIKRVTREEALKDPRDALEIDVRVGEGRKMSEIH